MIRLLLLLSLALLCKPLSIKAQHNTPLPTSVLIQIDSLFADYQSVETPGYAIGISQNGETVLKKGYGAANLDYEIPISTRSMFSLASVSKRFTAACIALLILDGDLDLETPVLRFFPELKKYPDTVRLKHLLYNTSGLHECYDLSRKGAQSWISFNYFEIEECLELALAVDTLRFQPGTRWNYQNVNWMMLAKIVEQVSDQSFPAFAKARLFEPLGMQSTFFHTDATAIVKNRVTPYNHRTAEYIQAYAEQGVTILPEGDYLQHPRVSPHYGGSGLMSNIEDLLRWNAAMHDRKLGADFYDLMHHTPKFDHDRDNQALGLYFSNLDGRTKIAWDGGDYGISSQMMRFPDQGVAIIVLSNLGSGEAWRKADEIARILMKAGKL